jgi:predicted DNA-binding protein
MYTNGYILVYLLLVIKIVVCFIMTDTMVRVPKALQERFEKLEMNDSWKSFPAFVRESIRQSLDKYEKIALTEGK